VDYLPERAAGSHANENGQSEEEDLEEGDDDGFQQVGQRVGKEVAESFGQGWVISGKKAGNVCPAAKNTVFGNL